jgi:hypothetical protein
MHHTLKTHKKTEFQKNFILKRTYLAPSILQKLVASVCWGGFNLIFGFNTFNEKKECIIENNEQDVVVAVVIFWIVGCIIASAYL